MARLVFISPYLKGGRDAARLTYRTRYVATREGVELLPDEERALPVSKPQAEFILRLVNTFPESKELLEYEDYLATHTRGSASDFIELVREQYIDQLDKRENFVDYVAHRPGVQTGDAEHGLWNADGKVPVLDQVVHEVANHPGNVWTPVVSLRREDAERLGYADAENWRALVNSCIGEIADGYKIHPDHLHWYAAFHEKEKHVHIHMIIMSTDPKEGYLTKQGIRDIKSAFARQIFRQELISTYQKQTEYRNTLGSSAEEVMKDLIAQMESGSTHSEKLEHLTAQLSERLLYTSGKKVYGYLPPAVKTIVDEIVDELAKDERVSAAYVLWQEMRDEVCRTYSDNLPVRLPLSKQKEFKSVRNMVIREALKISSTTIQDVPADELTGQGDPQKEKEMPSTGVPGPKSSQSSDDVSAAYQHAEPSNVSVANAVARMLYHMGRIFRENAASGSAYHGMQIDKKHRKRLQEKRIAMGHKADDHEDKQNLNM
ncbi:MobP3 family relaxase [uncultured Oscillibacter sp.]|uniref:MobP3 family relaxase n=1 Tax=uncultured Oscillibacter sp. TaxID=876091 RepID=UPI0025FA0C16|nr:MobP3 family relaxase [uncultured Oscillibacter sp.]